ncbi:MAG: hypothetical protein MJ010_07455 [Paludibacteraceae bacterium]|nr:hypothetical protein [Paludibacteraceae bacterium]
MKKIIYMAGAALMMLASASCKKNDAVRNNEQSSVEKSDMVFTASSKGGLKTTVSSSTTVIWSATDKLKVFTAEDTSGSECILSSGAGETTAEFTGQCAKNGPWTAICPASSATGFSNGTITLTMPATQTYTAGTFAAGALPCVAYAETNTFEFDHSFGLLKLSLKLKSGKTGSVKSITVTDKGGAKLNGTFTVTPSSGATATKSGTDGTASITLNCGTGVALSTSSATDFWIVVPAGAFASGFDVTVTSTNDIPAAITAFKDNTIVAGAVTNMPVQVIEFTPTTGTAKRNGNVDVNWVQLWAGGPKFAEYNVGASSKTEHGVLYGWGTTETDKEYYVTSDTDIQYGEHDTAKNLWGENWQMPTVDDLSKLCNKYGEEPYAAYTDGGTWVTDYNGSGVNGVVIKGLGAYANNSIFLSAAGYWYYQYESEGIDGFYWSSRGGSGFWIFGTNRDTPSFVSALSSGFACSVRAILHE